MTAKSSEEIKGKVATRDEESVEPLSDGAVRGVADQGTGPYTLEGLVEALKVYIGMLAVTAYPVGFVALTWQISRDPAFPSDDLYMAWYAASLVPPLTVLSTAALVLLSSLLVAACFTSVGLFLFYARRWRSETGSSVALGRHQGRWLVVSILVLAIVAVALWAGLFPLLNTNPDDVGRNERAWAGAFLFAAGTGAYAGYKRAKHPGEWMRRGAFVACVGAVVAALLIASTQYPALPQAEINSVSDIGSIQSAPEQKHDLLQLLGHSGGRWYGYSVGSGIVSIPDDEVGTVLMWDAALQRSHVPAKTALVVTGAVWQDPGEYQLPKPGSSHTSQAADELMTFFGVSHTNCVETSAISYEAQKMDAQATVGCSYGYVDADLNM